MKRFINLSLIATLAILIIVSCSKQDEFDQPADGINSLNQLKTLGAVQQAAFNAMIENGWSKVCYFVDTSTTRSMRSGNFIPSGPQGFILTEGEFPAFSAFGGFSAMGGWGDFIYIHPNGQATLHIRSNDADCFYTDQTVFPFVNYEGFNGRMLMHHTGELVAIPQHDGTFLYLVTPNNTRPQIWHGNGKVVEYGTTSPEFRLKADYIVNRNGNVIINRLNLK
jgi:hypothetical protein